MYTTEQECLKSKTEGTDVCVCVFVCGAVPGSAECKRRWLCTSDDFYESQSPCDKYNQVISHFSLSSLLDIETHFEAYSRIKF